MYNDGGGTERYFVEIDGKYIDEDGRGLTLTVSGSGSDKEYRIKTETDEQYVFGSDGKITYITDVHGNKKRFSYNDNGSLYAIYYQPVNGSMVQQLVFAYNTDRMPNIRRMNRHRKPITK